MTDTTCPNCNAPAPPGARTCRRCGYEFVEGGSPPHSRPRAGRAIVAMAAVAGAVVLGVLLMGGGDGEEREVASPDLDTSRRLERLSPQPLATRAVERRLEARYSGMRDDDTAAVRCSEREARPAHSIRRCSVRYPSGIERVVVLLTSARGAEVISEP